MDAVSVLAAAPLTSDFRASETGKSPSPRWFAVDQPNALLNGLATHSRGLAMFSPIVLHGPSGTGKSHLANILADLHVGRGQPASSPLHTTASEFARRLRHAVVVEAVAETMAVWEGADCWIIDDFQSFSATPFLDQALCQLLELRNESGRLTIVASRLAPQACAQLSGRLVSRLSAGLSLEVQQAGPMALRRITSEVARSVDVTCSEAALDEIAKVGPPPGALIDFVRGQAPPAGGSIDLTSVRLFLTSLAPPAKANGRAVVSAVAHHFGVKQAELVGPSRRQALVQARGVAICLLRDLTKMTWQAIAELIGRQDHTTVLHAYSRTRRLFQLDRQLAEAYTVLRQRLSPQAR